jgi:hypothetical protein
MTVDEQVRPNGRARMVTRPFIEPAWAFDYVDQGGGEVLIGYRRTAPPRAPTATTSGTCS